MEWSWVEFFYLIFKVRDFTFCINNDHKWEWLGFLKKEKKDFEKPYPNEILIICFLVPIRDGI